MNNDRLAINFRTALIMFWDAGYNTEDLITKAATLIKTLTPVSNEFYYADEVANLIKNNITTIKMFTVSYSLYAQRHLTHWVSKEYKTLEEVNNAAIKLLSEGFYVKISD